MKLVREATEAAETKKEKEKEAGTWAVGGRARRRAVDALCLCLLPTVCRSLRRTVWMVLPSPVDCQAACPNHRLPPATAAVSHAGKAAKEGGSASPENQFIRGTIALHDKYMEYVQVRLRVGRRRGAARRRWGAHSADSDEGRGRGRSPLHAPGAAQIVGGWKGAQPRLILCPARRPLPIAPPPGLLWQLLALPQGAQGGVRGVLQQAGALVAWEHRGRRGEAANAPGCRGHGRWRAARRSGYPDAVPADAAAAAHPHPHAAAPPQVASASVAELMASFCDNLLKKVGGWGGMEACSSCCAVQGGWLCSAGRL